VVVPWTGVIAGNWPSNTLRLQDFDIYEALKIDDPKKLDWKDHTFDLHSRRLEGAVFTGAKLGKVNLHSAHLEGAFLVSAKLQGASLEFAELRGASLLAAQLQGASLFGAQLQGASLEWAQLQGASLHGTQLQGATLDSAQLQGAELEGAVFNGTRFLGAPLWRTAWERRGPAQLGAIQLGDAAASVKWKPLWKKDFSSGSVRWDNKAYAGLRDLMNSIPKGRMRDNALERIKRLDCANTAFAPCDATAKPPPDVLEKLKAASVDEAAFAKALVAELRGLLCASDANAIHILRGIIRTEIAGNADRLSATGPEAPALVEDIMKKCPVSAALTDDDKAKLLKIKQDAEEQWLYGPTTADMK
jgi:uncharacterized protein YjbI with pentapeptide repeats